MVTLGGRRSGDSHNKRIECYDLMRKRNLRCLNSLKKYIQDESLDKKKQEYLTNNLTFEHKTNIKQQENDSDCGMFCFRFAKCIFQRAAINFRQNGIAAEPFECLEAVKLQNARIIFPRKENVAVMPTRPICLGLITDRPQASLMYPHRH